MPRKHTVDFTNAPIQTILYHIKNNNFLFILITKYRESMLLTLLLCFAESSSHHQLPLKIPAQY